MIAKLLKRFSGAALLAAIALPLAAQQLTVPRGVPQQAAPKTADVKPKYLVVFGKVLARTDKHGTTSYQYQNGRLVSEKLPNGVIGTYQYDSGKFTGIAYTDGRYIQVALTPSGALSGLTTNTGARVKFASAKAKQSRLHSFLAIQNGIAALAHPTLSNECIGTDGDTTCTVHVYDSLPDDSGWGGGGGISDEMPFSGEGGGGVSNPPGEDPNTCRQFVCGGAIRNFTEYCRIATANPISHQACLNKVFEYDQRCKISCVNGDWHWLDFWTFSW